MFASLSTTQKRRLWAYSMLALPIVYFLIVRVAPLIYSFVLSFSNWNVFSATANFVGVQNYIQLFNDPVFWKSLKNTMMYVVVGVPSTLAISLFFAFLIDKIQVFKGLYKTIYFLPYMVSLVAVSWIWRWIFRPEGLLNSILGFFGVPPQGFLLDPNQALFCIVAATVWRYIGFNVVIFLAGLKNIPKMYYDAAEVDGASTWQTFTRITLPLLNPTILVLAVMNTIYYLRIFTQVLNMTQQGFGGPFNSTKPLVLYLYERGFRNFNMGYASAVTLVLFLLIMTVTLLQFRYVQRDVSYY